MCYATTLIKDDKFAPRADACVMMGYSPTQKGYVLYNLSLKKFEVSRDMTFKEHIFPFGNMQDMPVPIFCRQDRLGDDEDTPELHNSLISDNDAVSAEQQQNFEHVPLVDTENISVDVSNMDYDEQNIQTITAHRTSTRMSHPPVWMKDYVAHMTDSKHSYSLAKYMTYDKLSPTYQAYLSDLSADTEPRNYEEAVKDSKWVKTMQQKLLHWRIMGLGLSCSYHKVKGI